MTKLSARLLFSILIVLIPCAAQAQVRIEYGVTIPNPVSHLYNVSMEISGMRGDAVDVAMPAWTPGVYLIRDFARNVQDFSARSNSDKPLTWEQRDKQTWRIHKLPDDDLRVHYQVYSTELNDVIADMSTPASTFMYVVGEQQRPVGVNYDLPARWDVYTTLEKRDRYQAPDYDALVDAPVLMGRFKVVDIETAHEVTHRLVISQPDVSMIEQQVTSDLADIVDAAIDALGPPPYRQYTFFIKVQTTPGGQPRSSQFRTNRCRRKRFRQSNELSTVSVNGCSESRPGMEWKTHAARLQPAGLPPGSVYPAPLVDRGRQHISRGHHFRSCGRQHAAGVLRSTLTRCGRVANLPGRRAMSLEEASINTWVRSDNGVNNTVSYISKGDIVGLLLDLDIRSRTKNQKRIEDVIHYLDVNYSAKAQGVPEDGLVKALQAVTGSDFQEFFDANVRGRGELNYNRYLNLAGLAVEAGRALHPSISELKPTARKITR